MRKGRDKLSIKDGMHNENPCSVSSVSGSFIGRKKTSECETNHIQMTPSEKLSAIFDPNRASALNVALYFIY